MPYCPECGAENSEDAQYCQECGHDLSSDGGDTEAASDESGGGGITGRIPGMKPGSTIRNLVVGVVWLFLILIVLGIAFGGGGDTGGDTNAGNGNAPTDTPTNIHEVGETFTVGSGEKSIEYTVNDVSVQDTVGTSVLQEEADGVFVVIQLEMTNVGDESLSLSSDVFRLVDSQDREYETDSDAVLAIEDNVIYEQLDPGITKEGTVVFDVPQDQEGRQLKIEPAGLFSGAENHFVELEA